MNDRSSTPLFAAAMLAVIAIALWAFVDQTTPRTTSTPGKDAAASPPAAPIPVFAVGPTAPEIPPDLPAPKAPVVVSPEALKDMDDVQFMLRDFRTRLGGNPEGTNAEIMRKVMGRNRVQAKLGPPEGQKLNDQGELVDRWGAPYFFHQLSSTQMEIRSAGPDRAMYTNDDIVVR